MSDYKKIMQRWKIEGYIRNFLLFMGAIILILILAACDKTAPVASQPIWYVNDNSQVIIASGSAQVTAKPEIDNEAHIEPEQIQTTEQIQESYGWIWWIIAIAVLGALAWVFRKKILSIFENI